MQFTLIHMILAAVLAYVVYQYLMRESMTNAQSMTTAISVVVGIVLIGAAYMYASSK